MSLGHKVLHDLALKQVWKHLPESRLVGGSVRDLLMGVPVHDFDFATPQPPKVVTQILSDAGFKMLETGLRHGTVIAIIDRRPFEITTLRRDVSTDGRHAVVAWTDDWQEDAARRDFTINAMYCDRFGKVHDYFGGQADLASRRVRFVGDAEKRIQEDALRILRYFRFLGRLDARNPDQRALSAIERSSALIDRLSAERVASEMTQIVSLEAAPFVLSLMQESGVLAHIIEDADLALFSRLVSLGAPAEPRLRFAALRPSHDDVQRLKLSRLDTRFIIDLCSSDSLLNSSLDDAVLRRLLSQLPSDRLMMQSWLDQATDQSGASSRLWDDLRKRIGALKAPVFPLQGRDLIDQGDMISGKPLGRILQATEEWWRERGCIDDKSACLTHALALRGVSHSRTAS